MRPTLSIAVRIGVEPEVVVLYRLLYQLVRAVPVKSAGFWSIARPCTPANEDGATSTSGSDHAAGRVGGHEL